MSLVCVVGACVYARDPTGLPDVRGAHTSSQGGLVYAEERRWVIDTTPETFVVNDLVSKVGSATGWSSGYVQRTCVNVSPAQGVTLYCQNFANYEQDDGDSGAPILLDINEAADSTVTLGGIHSGRAGSNSVFSPWSGIVQDYGSLSVVPVQEDTTRLPVPESRVLPDDSSRTFAAPWGTGERYYRDIVGVMFHDTTSGRTIRAILKKYQASIIAGGVAFPYALYYLQVPDPGGTYAAIDSVARAIDSEPGVFGTYIPQWRGRVRIRSRYPNDGPSARRADWCSPTDATRSLLQGGADSTVTLGGIHSGKAGKDAVFGPWSGIVQNHTSLSVVPAPQGTTRPPVPTDPLSLPADSSTTIRQPGAHPDNVYYRNVLELVFHDSTSGVTVRDVLARYQAEIIGGSTFSGIAGGAYVIQVPDPGATWEALQDMLSGLRAEPGVYFVRAMPFSVYWYVRSRFPNEAPGSPWSGIVQDYGSLAVVPAQQDTTRPPVPPTPNLPDDSTFTVPSPSGSEVRYHRNIVVIAFDDSTSGVSVRRILAKFTGVIIGGSEARDEPAYYVQIPDPGTTFARIDAVASLIEAEPGVKWVSIPTWRGLIRIRYRYPEDGPQSTRRDWLSPTDAGG